MASLSQLSYTYEPELAPQDVVLPDGTVYSATPTEAAPAAAPTNYVPGSTYIPPGAAESPQTASTPPPPAYVTTGGGSNTSDYTGSPAPAPAPLPTATPSSPAMSNIVSTASQNLAPAYQSDPAAQQEIVRQVQNRGMNSGAGPTTQPAPPLTRQPANVMQISPSNATNPSNRSNFSFDQLNRDHGAIRRPAGPIGAGSPASAPISVTSQSASPLTTSVWDAAGPIAGRPPVSGGSHVNTGGGWSGLMDRVRSQQANEGVVQGDYSGLDGSRVRNPFGGSADMKDAELAALGYDPKEPFRSNPNATTLNYEVGRRNAIANTPKEQNVEQSISSAVNRSGTINMTTPGDAPISDMSPSPALPPPPSDSAGYRNWIQNRFGGVVPKGSGPGTGGSSSTATPPKRPTTGDFSGPTMTPHSPAVDRNVASMTPRERDLYTGKANTVDGSPLIDAGGNFSPKVINDSIAEGSMTKGEDGKLYFTDTGEEVTKESTQAWMQKSGWLSGTPATQSTTEASGDLLAQPAASTAPETTTSTTSDGSGGGGGNNNYYKKSYSGGGGSGRSSGGYGRSSGGSWSSGRSSGGRGGGFDFASMFGGGDFDPDTDGDGKISAKEARAAKKRRGRKGRMGKGGTMMPGGPPSDIRAYVLGQLGEGFGRPVGGWPEQMNAPTTSKKKKKN
jgi:hypothetical protein